MTPEIVSDVLRAAMKSHAAAGRVALDGEDFAVSYADMLEAIDQAAAGFQAWGGPHGRLLGILGPRGLPAIAAFFGAMQAGACACLIEPNLSADVLTARMQAVGMQHLVLDPSLLSDASVLRAAGVHVKNLADLPGGSFRPIILQPHDRAMMLFTSGSTGQPKGVLLSHANLACNARGVIAHTELTSNDRLLHVMPLFHTNGINNQLSRLSWLERPSCSSIVLSRSDVRRRSVCAVRLT